MNDLAPLSKLKAERFETVAIFKKLAMASRQLAELKGVAASMPQSEILIDTLGLQEAKASSEIENIVTTQDALFQGETALLNGSLDPATKEVLRYRHALKVGYQAVKDTQLLTQNDIVSIQKTLEQNNAAFRKLPGTTLQDSMGRVVYTPPQDYDTVVSLMTDLEKFINDDENFKADPLIKMTLIHHQFESIHPFYDGNGRTGRIINVLYLVKLRLLNTPILYLSRYINQNKAEYYRLLQAVRDDDAWEEWVLYMLTAVEVTAAETITTIHAINEAFLKAKHAIRSKHKFYSQDLINHLFSHPYTKIEHMRKELGITRLTATRYLDALADDGLLMKLSFRTHYYVNLPLCNILAGLDDKELIARR